MPRQRKRRYHSIKRLSSKGKKVTYIAEAQGSGLIKVGMTGNLTARIASLNSQSALRVVLLRTISDPGAEVQLHRLLKNHRHHGEWFHFNLQTCDIINSFRRGEPGFNLLWPGMSEWRQT